MSLPEKLLADVLCPDAPNSKRLLAYARAQEGLDDAERAEIEHYLAESPAHRDRLRLVVGDQQRLLGSCLCGAIRYAIAGPMRRLGHCHCRVCQKAGGSAFGSFGIVAVDQLEWLAGQERLSHYAPAPNQARSFCRDCGAPLTGPSPFGSRTVAIALGSLDADPLFRPSLHVNVAAKVSWCEINDDLPRFDTGPPTGTSSERDPI